MYLLTFHDNLSIQQNIEKGILSPMSIMRKEPLNLLRMELREPLFYNSILSAISDGATKSNDVAQKVQDENTKVNKYLETLKVLRIISKVGPYGEFSTRKNLFYIKDNYFKFWYRFIFQNERKIALLRERKMSEIILDTLSDYMGLVFEEICFQYMTSEAKKGHFPFVPNGFGKWWENNHIKKRQDDIDIIGIDANKGIFCECKFRNELFNLSDFNDFIDASYIFPQINEKYYYIFVKSDYTQVVKDCIY